MLNNKPHAYSLTGHGKLIADSIRTNAYIEALRRVIKPDSVVLDLGAGTGIFALIACRLGAAGVYAIEPDDTISVAKELASHNGLASRIQFIQGVSTAIDIPEKVSIVVSDLRGVLPLFQQHISSIVDVRRRFLADGGILIPNRDVIWGNIVEAPEIHQSLTDVWNNQSSNAIRDLGIDLTLVNRFVTQSWCKVNCSANQLLRESKQWIELDYSTQDATHFAGTLAWKVTRAGNGHGIVLWFDSHLMPGIAFSNAPSSEKTIYGQAYFPWPNAVSLDTTDTIEVKLNARLIRGEYIWQWDTMISGSNDEGKPRVAFRQTNFLGVPLSPSSMTRRAAHHVPELGFDGRLDYRILALMNDGKANPKQIAQTISREYSALFPNWEDAMMRVGEVSDRYSSSQ